MNQTRIFIAVRDPLLVSKLQQQLTQIGFDLIGQTCQGLGLYELVESLHPDLVILDLGLEGTPLDIAEKINSRLSIPILFLDGRENETLEAPLSFDPQRICLPILPSNRELLLAIGFCLSSRQFESRLTDSEYRYHALVADLHVGVLIQLPDTQIVLSNRKALELLGLTEDQLLGKSSLDPDWNVIHEDGTPFPGPTHPVPQAISTRRPVRDVVMGVYRPVTGDRVWLLVSAEPELTLEGSVRHVVCTFTEITARIQAEKQRNDSDERLKFAIKVSNVGLWDWDLLTNTAVFSREWKSQLGYDDHEIENEYQEWERRLHPNDLARTLKQLQDCRNGRAASFEVEFRMLHRDGTWRWIFSKGEIIRDASRQPLAMLGCHIDVTNQKQIDFELRESRQRLKSLSSQLIRTREMELRHLARELHDEFGQVLTAMKMNLQSVQRGFDQANRVKLDPSIHTIEQTIEQIRNLALDLRPPHLDELGLVATLHWYLKNQAKASGFQEHISVNPPDLRVTQELAIVCFRIAQEAVTNAIRHANPKRIDIEVTLFAQQLHIKIRDDGQGFDVPTARVKASNGGSIGMLGMQERASLADGEFEIESSAGQGTTVHAWFPFLSKSE